MNIYVIKHKRLPEYWQTRVGWGEAKNATEFPESVLNWMPLPPHGEWLFLAPPARVKGTA